MCKPKYKKVFTKKKTEAQLQIMVHHVNVLVPIRTPNKTAAKVVMSASVIVRVNVRRCYGNRIDSDKYLSSG